jgi:glycosyltransferase involved in cell wall biosynthesis
MTDWANRQYARGVRTLILTNNQQSTMKETRIAWLVPAIMRGAYWQPVLREFIKTFPNTIFYTSQVWPDFDPTVPGASVIQIFGKYRFAKTQKIDTGYSRGFILTSPGVIFPVLRYKPDIVFVSSFSLWTLLAILFKAIGGWQIILVYDGGSPNVDFRDDSFRINLRRWMVKSVDAFATNSKAGRDYLINLIGVPPAKIEARPYIVPDTEVLLQRQAEIAAADLDVKRPIFLCVGLLIARKGVKYLLEACAMLKRQGYENYTLILVGDGGEREALQAYAKEQGIDNQLMWTGWLEYGRLGAYFQSADVFVFPTLEDIWGMVVPEAMAFGKAMLCSKWAGAVEMMVDGENGYIFDPYDPETLAQSMKRFIDTPELAAAMGQKSQELVADYNPVTAANFLGDRVRFVLDSKSSS